MCEITVRNEGQQMCTQNHLPDQVKNYIVTQGNGIKIVCTTKTPSNSGIT